MRNITQDQLNKLPKWAKEHLAHLNSEIRDLQLRIDLLEGNAEGSGLVSYKGCTSHLQDNMVLPDHTIIQFGIGPASMDVSCQKMRNSKGDLELMLQVYGRSSLLINPRAANAFHVKANFS